ncbi:MAG TPA: phage terminase small subunit P27 family [Pirellulales bacterium]
MARRGPKPMSSAELEARGSNRAKGRKAQEQAVAAPPTRPAWLGDVRDELNGVLLGAWDELVAHLDGRKVLSPGDQVALAMLCEAIRDYVKAKRIVWEEGETVPGARPGTIVVNPMSRVRDKAFHRCFLLLRDFGLTPSARAGAAIMEGAEKKAKAIGPDKTRFFTPPA